MTSRPDITNYAQLLAEGNLGSQNVDFYNSQAQLVPNSPALNTLSYHDDYFGATIPTYGAVCNYYERNRRLNGAYGNAYYGEVNFVNPVNQFSTITDNHFYYLQDFVGSAPYAHLFIKGLTWFTRTRPQVYYQYYNASFIDTPNAIYRVDVLGEMYPYNYAGKKPDIIIQEFAPTRTSDKLYLTFGEAFGHPYHDEYYQMRVPVSIMLFNDKLYDASIPPIITQPDDDPVPPPVQTPPDDEPLQQDQDPFTTSGIQEDQYANFGGDTTDTGPTANIDQPINPYFDRTNPRYVDEYFPSFSSWRNIFRWY
jgi:hypothetical protein